MPSVLRTHKIILPLEVEQGRRFAFSRLVAGPEAQVGLLCLDNPTSSLLLEELSLEELLEKLETSEELKTVEELEMSTRLSFFHLDASSQKVSSRQRPWHVLTGDAHLSYDEQWQTWVVCHSTGSAELSYVLLAPEQEEWLQTLIHVDDYSNRFLALPILLARTDQAYHILYYGGAIDEVSDNDVYWVAWDSAAWRLDGIPRQTRTRLGYCDRARGHVFGGNVGEETRYFLFRLIRQYDEEPVWWPRIGSGAWRLQLHVYASEHKLITSSYLTDASVRFSNPQYPSEDLFKKVETCMMVGEGPHSRQDQQPTCVAVMLLEERPPESQPAEPSRQLGGLFCFDRQGNVLGTSQSRLGEMLSFCSCGRSVIGADLLQGQGRLWSWSPFSNDPLQVWKPLDASLSRATVVAHALHSTQFWLVEEYAHTVKVSLYVWQEVEGGRELATTWLEQVTLPPPLLSHLPGEDRQAIILAQGNSLLLVGKDEQERFALYQVKEDWNPATTQNPSKE